MSLGHKKSVVANCGYTASACGSSINGNEFPEYILFADYDPRGLTLEFQVLRFCADGYIRIKSAAFTDLRRALYIAMRSKTDIIVNGDIITDDSVRTDFNSR